MAFFLRELMGMLLSTKLISNTPKISGEREREREIIQIALFFNIQLM